MSSEGYMNHTSKTKSSQTGAVILMLCHMFMLAALALSVASYAGIYALSTDIQKEIEYRKQFWLAEAGLECGFSWFTDRKKAPTYQKESALNGCDLSSSVEVKWGFEGDKHYTIMSRVGHITLSRQVFVQVSPDYDVLWVKGSWQDVE